MVSILDTVSAVILRSRDDDSMSALHDHVSSGFINIFLLLPSCFPSFFSLPPSLLSSFPLSLSRMLIFLHFSQAKK